MCFGSNRFDYRYKVYRDIWNYIDKSKSIGFETKLLSLSVNKIIKEIDNFVVVRFVEYDNMKSSYKKIGNYIKDMIKYKDLFIIQEI